MNLVSAQEVTTAVARSTHARRYGRPLRLAMVWQMSMTAVFTLIAAYLAGTNGALSAALGGLICTCAFAIAGWAATRKPAHSATEMVTSALFAEMVKVGLMVALLGLVLFVYSDVVPVAMIATFVGSVIILALAVFIRDSDTTDSVESHGKR